MDHPLLRPEQKELRQRVIAHLKTGYKAYRSSNIVFVCGGTEQAHMRIRFVDYCKEALPNFEIFLPETAMPSLFGEEADEPFDIAAFEELISELSHAVVVFPEAPGSWAETGYFSAIDKIAARCILVLDSRFQEIDSFISLGPQKKIEEKTVFQPVIQIDYENPNFGIVSERIKRFNLKRPFKNLLFDKYKEVSVYELSCIIWEVVNILTIATSMDVDAVFRILFKNSYSAPRIRKLLSVLTGAQYLIPVGEFGHYRINPVKPKLLDLREGYLEKEQFIRLSLAEIYESGEIDFLELLKESHDAA